MNAYKILPDGSHSKLSLNELCMDHLPWINNCGNWEGEKGREIYSGELLKRQVENSFQIRFHTETEYIAYMKNLINTQNNWNSQFTYILSKLALGFSSMFYLLVKQPDYFIEINCLEEADCTFWKNCKIIIMCANFLQGAIGHFMENKINEYLIEAGLRKLRIKCCNFEVTPSLIGCYKVADCQNQIFVYDFGSTRIKRGFTTPNNTKIRELEPIYIPRHDFEKSSLLYKRMIQTIVNDIYKYAPKEQKYIEVSLCMANNIMHGEINTRGRYGILKEFGKNYQLFFQNQLEQELNKKVPVHMMNDAEAVANLYTQYAPEAVVLTLGTGIGIGYPHVLKSGDT